MARSFVNADNTRHRPSGVYGKAINQIMEDGVCPFCPEHIARYHPNPILRRTEFWQLTRNAYPYEGAKHHFLVIHTVHIEHITEVSTRAWADLQMLLHDTVSEYGIKGGALVFRFGETKYNGASVAHLHAQVVMGPGKPNAQPVLMRVG